MLCGHPPQMYDTLESLSWETNSRGRPSTSGRKHLRFRLGINWMISGRTTYRSFPPVLPAPKNLPVTPSCTRGLWKTERAGPYDDSRMILGEVRTTSLLNDLEVPVRGLGVASRSRTAFPPADVSLELEAALPVSSQSTPPCARVLHVHGSSWDLVEPVGDMPGRRNF